MLGNFSRCAAGISYSEPIKKYDDETNHPKQQPRDADQANLWRTIFACLGFNRLLGRKYKIERREKISDL